MAKDLRRRLKTMEDVLNNIIGPSVFPSKILQQSDILEKVSVISSFYIVDFSFLVM